MYKPVPAHTGDRLVLVPLVPPPGPRFVRDESKVKHHNLVKMIWTRVQHQHFGQKTPSAAIIILDLGQIHFKNTTAAQNELWLPSTAWSS